MKRTLSSLVVVVVMLLVALLPVAQVTLADDGSDSSVLDCKKPVAVVLTWDVQFGVLRYGQYWDTRWFVKASVPTSLYATTYFRPGMLPAGVQYAIGPEGVERFSSGDPSYLWCVFGYQLSSSATGPSFAGMRWNPNIVGDPGPHFQLVRDGKKNQVVVTNTTTKLLYLAVNGKHERVLMPGQVFSKKFNQQGEICLMTAKGTSGQEAAALWWKN